MSKLNSKLFVKIEPQMTWPVPGNEMDNLAYMMVHSQQHVSQRDLYNAVAIFDAYEELVRCSRKKRELIVRELRKAMVEAEDDK